MSAQEALAARNSAVELKCRLGVNTELGEQKLTERRLPKATRHSKYVQ
jgi:hypothetical protein